MEIYLLRHGIAEDASPGSSDAARELTPEGREKTAAVLKRARGAGVFACGPIHFTGSIWTRFQIPMTCQ